MRTRITLLTLILLLGMFLCGCGMQSSTETPENAQTDGATDGAVEDARAEALSAYRELLSAAPAVEGEHEEFYDAAFDYDSNREKFGEHYDLFALYDINRDGIPELLAQSTVNFRWTPLYVYTFSDGNAVLLRDPSDAQAHAHGTFEHRSTANGAYITYICEENHIHSVWRGTDPAGGAAEENRAYSLEGTTLTEAVCTAGENESTVFFNDIAKPNNAENAAALTQLTDSRE